MKTVLRTRRDGKSFKYGTFCNFFPLGNWFTIEFCKFWKVCHSATTVVTANLSTYLYLTNICTFIYFLSKFGVNILLRFLRNDSLKTRPFCLKTLNLTLICRYFDRNAIMTVVVEHQIF